MTVSSKLFFVGSYFFTRIEIIPIINFLKNAVTTVTTVLKSLLHKDLARGRTRPRGRPRDPVTSPQARPLPSAGRARHNISTTQNLPNYPYYILADTPLLATQTFFTPLIIIKMINIVIIHSTQFIISKPNCVRPSVLRFLIL